MKSSGWQYKQQPEKLLLNTDSYAGFISKSWFVDPSYFNYVLQQGFAGFRFEVVWLTQSDVVY